MDKFSGDHSEGEIPDPIPNSAVKPFCANGTTWVTLWESRTSPGINMKVPSIFDGTFFIPFFIQ
jgi:hypothetical protein